ncbi:SUMF1/EgtB/PvdO family nonheme iron enzyme [Treponema sp.]|uniref:SUMF1/EgtB/PvdO family nonheme iron enzyme n=1 Tax=Treponema sp. TaxID=166 RepID=UPI002A84046B|nr:SUMF1/EgtB/PvdO family nonheme iron enzyme [Treponema sp.]MCI6442088.1 SUMF1/EgtB/PvdO family nonheme iron enzyme [Spirochaetia bacterium]MDY4133674.1 SUMF1/EgtB/PvdO family nonheme iron enzyme [Treponema sp.]
MPSLLARSHKNKKGLSPNKKVQTGASSGSNRVQRGGSWYNNDNNCQVSNRNNNNPNNRNNNYGFRVVRSSS